MFKKVYSLESLKKIVLKQKSKGKKIVLCHGVFDLLHIGHIKHFNEAKSLGDILIVTVTPDKYVGKGLNRPVFTLSNRMESIAALKNVDYVVPNLSANAVQPIKILKPNIYCKGKDYKNHDSDITGQIKEELKAIKSIKGKIFYTKTELFSSSKIINAAGLNLSKEQKVFLNKIKTNKNFDSDNKILNAMNSFSNLKILIIGETMIDEYVFCEALGKSGKEPVLVLRDINKERYIGGTAAIARNLSSFCKKITLLTNIGERKEEKQFIKKHFQKNINTVFLTKKNSPTIIKKRFVEYINKTKILGVYSINDQPLNKQEELKFNRNIIKFIKKHDLVIVSDYGHGLISDNSAKLIVKNSKFLAVNTQVNATNLGFHVISKYCGANLTIINENELRHELRNKVDSLSFLTKKLSKRLRSAYTTVTQGDAGADIYIKSSNKTYNCPAFANKVADKVGTGDSMLALLAISIYKKLNINFCMFLSAVAAAFNIQSMANSSPLKKTSITKAIQSYLK